MRGRQEPVNVIGKTARPDSVEAANQIINFVRPLLQIIIPIVIIETAASIIRSPNVDAKTKTSAPIATITGTRSEDWHRPTFRTTGRTQQRRPSSSSRS